MSQLLKKFALLTACAALAFCFAARPAQAQMVEPSGVGEHLLFAYWSVDDGMNTNINIHSPLNVTGGIAPDKNVVYVRVRSDAFDRNIVASFNICLNAADSWTATLSEEGLMVMDEGGCDGDLRDLASNPSNQNVPTPTMDGDPVDLGATTSGYIEAWLNPANTLKDDKGMGAPDADHNPEDGSARYISGSAMLVSPMSGFSSSYNATALSMCGNVKTDAAGTLVSQEAPKTIKEALDLTRDRAANTLPATDGVAGGTFSGDDGNGCWHVKTNLIDDPEDTGTEIDQDKSVDTAGDPIVMALGDAGASGGGDRDLLIGRWTAIDDDHVMSHTKVVLTFPRNDLNEADGTSDPVSIHIYDDMGTVAGRSFGLELTMGVNMCTFGGMDMMDKLSCNGTEVTSLGGATSGEFRIFNNHLKNAVAGELPELSNQTPAEALPAIGLVCSYFEGTDGKQYDQITSVQWIDVDRDGNDGDPADGTGNQDDGTGFTDTGLDDF